MHFTAFHLMPYRPLDLDAAKEHRAHWVVLPNSLYDPIKGADEYAAYIDQLVSAEALGFDAIAVNEHHQTAYGLMPAPNLIASALIQRTRTVKISVFGRALPLLNNPLAIAEEFAMLDNLSRGRLLTGFVRGIGAEYHSSGINPAFSHERYTEAHDLIVQAWTRPGPFQFDGDHYNFRYVNIWPRPYQQPHPPVWVPSQGSRETIEWAAAPERRYPFLVTFSTEENVARYLTAYREQARKYGYEADAGQLGWAAPVYIADTEEQAISDAREGIETLFNHYNRMPWEMLLPPGYSSIASMTALIKRRASAGVNTKFQSIEHLRENGTVIVGTAAQVRDQIARMRDRTGLRNLVAMLQFGKLPNDLAERNMQRFAADIIPQLRD
jgi:alkanesulfonate monooxygenase SsuD/methylene tetrahydromethanopterin reductase-like flavin-dependent oxidoreductase (luciferase family)